MSALRVFLLGPPRIERDGIPITPGRHKSTALLAYLAVTRQSHSRDELATLLWPESDQTAARASLRRGLTAMKKDLGEEWLDAERDLVGVKPEADLWVDVVDLRRLLAECTTHGHPASEVCQACLTPLSQAVALYRGDFMEGFSLRDSPGFEEWQLLQSENLRQAVCCALSGLMYGYTIQHEFDMAIRQAQRWLELDPLDEAAHRGLMRLYAWSGKPGAAVTQYRECADLLRNELGLPPQEETTRLYQDIQTQRLTPPPSRYLPVPLVTSAARPHNLPLQLTPFIGRDAELAELSHLLDNPACRLVSLVGPGGIGKTRLAIQSAAQHLHAFRHGVFFTSLAPLSAPDFVVSTLADTLRFSFHGTLEPRLQLVNFLREKEMLLLLDNFEHVTAAAPLVADILESAPRIKTLVTSRERLNLHGEWVLEVPGLDFPSSQKSDGVARYSALRLFIESAQRHDASFALSDADKPHVVRICQLVEGTPLAIELAAAWVRTLSPGDIAHEIERDIDFLASTQHNLPARHRSLRAVFDHSWSLLGAPERAALMALSVFRGGFRREAAGQVAQVSTHLLASLVDRSILRRHASGRYDLHDLLRQYALKKLEENPAQEQAVKEQYGQYYAEFLHQRERFLRAGRQKDILREVAEEIENVRATWQWAVDRAKWDVVQRCTESLFLFYELRSLFQEGAETFGFAAQRLESSPSLGERASDQRVLGNVLARQARCLQRSSHFDAARTLYRRGLDIYERLGTRQDRAFVLTYLGDICRMMGEYDEARRLLHDGIEISTESGDGYLLSRALNILGIVSSQQGDYVTAEKLYRDSLAIQRDLGDHIGMSQVLNNLGGIAFLSGDYAQARHLYEESLGIQAEISDLRGAAVSLANLGDVVQELGKLEEAKRIRQESLDIRREIGERHFVAYDLYKLGETTAALGQWREASDYYLQALQLSMEVKVLPVVLNALVGLAVLWSHQGNSRPALTLLEFVLNHPAVEREVRDRAEPLRAELASELGSDVIAEAQAKGRTRQLEEIAEYVWAQARA